MIPRTSALHWEWMIYLEMFLAGIAAGAYVTATILEMFGYGRSRLTRIAHVIAFPLMLAVAGLLIFDLGRPERFWHMNLQSERLLPVFKFWSPMSVGSWAVLVFSGFAFVSFVDALFPNRKLHGSTLGLLWSMVGGAAAFFVAGYSGVLLSTTNMPGWGETVFIGPLYIATAAVTGMATMTLIHALTGPKETEDLRRLERLSSMVIVWQMLMLVTFFISLGGAAQEFLHGSFLLVMIGAVVFGAVVPLGLRALARGASRGYAAALILPALFILIGGFLLRFAVVMGPQM